MKNEKTSSSKGSKTLVIILSAIIIILLILAGIFIGKNVASSNKIGEMATTISNKDNVITESNTQIETLNEQVNVLENDKEQLNNEISELDAEVNTFSVYYVADNEMIYSERVSKGQAVANVPNVPVKENYNGTWSANGQDIQSDTVITAVYTPKTFSINYIWQKYSEYSTVRFYECGDYLFILNSGVLSLIKTTPIENNKFTVYNNEDTAFTYEFTNAGFSKANCLTQNNFDIDFEGYGYDTFARSGSFASNYVAYFISFDNQYIWHEVANTYTKVNNIFFLYVDSDLYKIQFSDDYRTLSFTQGGNLKTGSLIAAESNIEDTIYRVDYKNNKAYAKDNSTGIISTLDYSNGKFKVSACEKSYDVNYDTYNGKFYIIGETEYKPTDVSGLPTSYKYGESVYITNPCDKYDTYVSSLGANPFEFEIVSEHDYNSSDIDCLVVVGQNASRANIGHDTYIANPVGDIYICVRLNPALS